MAQLFPPSSNSIVKAAFAAGALVLCLAVWVAYRVERTTYFTKAGVACEQPVPFSHKHHVSGLGIDCRYCHVSAEDSSFAGLPPTRTCMTCHSQVWTQAQMLAAVRRSAETGQAIAWTRVDRLPDYVYFDHSIHVRKGVACQTCHGRVQRMPLTWRGYPFPFHMKDCLACHRHPERFPREDAELARLSRGFPPGERGHAAALAEHVRLLTDCYTCHR